MLIINRQYEALRYDYNYPIILLSPLSFPTWLLHRKIIFRINTIAKVEKLPDFDTNINCDEFIGIN